MTKLVDKQINQLMREDFKIVKGNCSECIFERGASCECPHWAEIDCDDSCFKLTVKGKKKLNIK